MADKVCFSICCLVIKNTSLDCLLLIVLFVHLSFPYEQHTIEIMEKRKNKIMKEKEKIPGLICYMWLLISLGALQSHKGC